MDVQKVGSTASVPFSCFISFPRSGLRRAFHRLVFSQARLISHIRRKKKYKKEEKRLRTDYSLLFEDLEQAQIIDCIQALGKRGTKCLAHDYSRVKDFNRLLAQRYVSLDSHASSSRVEKYAICTTAGI